MTDLMQGMGSPNNPRFIEHDLISDGAVPAEKTDSNLVNPWGVSFGPSTPFWISENGTGLASVDSLDTGNAIKLNVHDPVTIPSPVAGGTSAPTGQAFANIPGAFMLKDGQPATFLFATEDGTIAGWNSGLNDTAEIRVNNSSNTGLGDPVLGGAVYKGLALGTLDGQTVLYAANFRHGTVDIYDTSFNFKGSFTDPTVTAQGFAPFDVQVLNGQLYVTFAKQDDMKHDDVKGAGNGFVDQFSPDGKSFVRIASGDPTNTTNNPLNSPWGLAIAPQSFGDIAGDLLVGNFGDGHISVFNQNTDKFLGQLTGPNGNTIAIDGLWTITPGNGAGAGDPNNLYFTAGINGEQDGLFGSLSPIPNLHSV
jgi:uncharacterized protein (TIGR03118 family)